MSRSSHGEYGQEVLVRGARGYVFTNNNGTWYVSDLDNAYLFADVLFQCSAEEDAVAWLRLWRLMNGLREDGTPLQS